MEYGSVFIRQTKGTFFSDPSISSQSETSNTQTEAERQSPLFLKLGIPNIFVTGRKLSVTPKEDE